MRSLVVLSNGVVGAEKQSIALSRASGCTSTVLRVLPRPIIARAPTAVHLCAARHVGLSRLLFDTASPDVRALFDLVDDALPAFAVSCGRASILASACLRRRAAGAVKTVHIGHPRCALEHFDHLVLPRHDVSSRGRPPADVPSHVQLSTGSLHAIDLATLTAATSSFALPEHEQPSPRVALLLGGGTAAAPYAADDAIATLRTVYAASKRAGGSLMVSTSRRSPSALVRAVAELAANDGRVRAWCPQLGQGGGAGSNPYHAFLARAELIVVTADSVNMVTEACAAAHFTSASVHVALGEACAEPGMLQLAGRGARRRLRAFLEHLLDGGAIEPFCAARSIQNASSGHVSQRSGRDLRQEIATQSERIAANIFGAKA